MRVSLDVRPHMTIIVSESLRVMKQCFSTEAYFLRRICVIVAAVLLFLSPLFVGANVSDSGFMSNCWASLIARVEDVGFDGLSESERVYFLVQIADAEVNNGGFHAICYNPSGEYGARFSDAFAAIGAPEKASLFDELNRIFGDEGLPEDFREREAAHSKLSSSEFDRIDSLDARYYNSEESIESLLRKWVDSEQICQ